MYTYVLVCGACIQGSPCIDEAEAKAIQALGIRVHWIEPETEQVARQRTFSTDQSPAPLGKKKSRSESDLANLSLFGEYTCGVTQTHTHTSEPTTPTHPTSSRPFAPAPYPCPLLHLLDDAAPVAAVDALPPPPPPATSPSSASNGPTHRYDAGGLVGLLCQITLGHRGAN